MTIDVVPLPRDLTADMMRGRSVVVFDVLRATTTMTAALSAGVKEIFVGASLETTASAARAFGPGAVTCGERDCVRPPGFTLGNSPGAFTPALAGRTVFMSTTNGTKAIVAAAGARPLFVAALVNASAVARVLAGAGLDVTLLCSGTDGLVSMEDLIGAGAVIEALAKKRSLTLGSDVATIAHELFLASKVDLPAALRRTRGGHNIIRNSLQDDIDFAARLDVFDVVGSVDTSVLRVSCVP